MRALRFEVPADDPPGDLRHALLLPGDPHADQPRGRRLRHRSRRVSFTVTRDAVRRRISDPGSFSPPELDEAVADLAFEITLHRNLVPERPGRRYARETKRPGGRYKTRKHGGVKPTPVAKWAGHSVRVLLDVYAKCIDGGEKADRDRIEKILLGW
ncbi:MAG: hypothetical protein ACRDQF_10645 [Thermocrispum sp.]